jgi:hypothetical protein
VQLIIQNNLADTAFVVCAFKETVYWKHRKLHSLEPLFRNMPSDLSSRKKQIYFTQSSQQCQLHTQVNAFSSLLECNENWTKASIKRSRSPNSNTVKKVNTGWTDQPLPIAPQFYEKRRAQNCSREPAIQARHNLL